MNLIARVAQDQLKARKDRDADKATLFTTLLGEAIAVGKNKGNREPTDEEVVKVISNFIKNATENADRWNHRNPASQAKRQVFLKEIELLTLLLPPAKEMMTAETLKLAIKAQADEKGSTFMNIGAVMKFFKENYAGNYDGKLLKQCFDEMIASNG